MAETKKYLTMKERICFTVGAFGRSGIYTLMSMFTLVFFQSKAQQLFLSDVCLTHLMTL